MKRKTLDNVCEILYTGIVIGLAMVLQYLFMMYVMNPIILWLVL